MRVVAGKHRGRTLKTLKGELTRPTSMRVKESMFSALTSVLGSFEDLVALDAFAGSGALGIEALSRGAQCVVFFERSRKAAGIVESNLRSINIKDSEAVVEIGDAFRLALRRRSCNFDLVFFDPPYAMAPEEVLLLVSQLEANDQMNADAIICYELAKKNKPACERVAYGLKWVIVSSKDFGETSYVILRKETR